MLKIRNSISNDDNDTSLVHLKCQTRQPSRVWSGWSSNDFTELRDKVKETTRICNWQWIEVHLGGWISLFYDGGIDALEGLPFKILEFRPVAFVGKAELLKNDEDFGRVRNDVWRHLAVFQSERKLISHFSSKSWLASLWRWGEFFNEFSFFQIRRWEQTSIRCTREWALLHVVQNLQRNQTAWPSKQVPLQKTTRSGPRRDLN